MNSQIPPSDTNSATVFDSDSNLFSASAIHQRKVQDLEGNYKEPNVVVVPLGAKDNNSNPEYPSLKPSVASIAPAPSQSSRFAYLDGLRGICAILIALRNWTDSTWADVYPDRRRSAISYVFTLSEWPILIFMILCGRVLTIKYTKSAVQGSPNPTSLASSVIRRPFRFLPLVAIVVFIQWRLALDGYTEVAGTTWTGEPRGKPTWDLIGPNFGDYLAFVAAMFFGVISPNVMNRLSSGVWTIAILYAGSNLVYFCSFIAGSLPKRAWLFYLILIGWFFFWHSYSYVFLIGLVFTEIDARGGWKAALNYTRLIRFSMGLSGMIIFATGVLIPTSMKFFNYSLTQYLAPHSKYFLESPLVSRINTPLLPGDTIAAIGLMIWVHTCRLPQWVLSTRFCQLLGKYSIGLYLMHEMIISTLLASAMKSIHLNNPEYTYDQLVVISLAILVSILIIAVVIFDIFLEVPSQYFAKWVYDTFFQCKWSFKELDKGVISFKDSPKKASKYFIGQFTPSFLINPIKKLVSRKRK